MQLTSVSLLKMASHVLDVNGSRNAHGVSAKMLDTSQKRRKIANRGRKFIFETQREFHSAQAGGLSQIGRKLLNFPFQIPSQRRAFHTLFPTVLTMALNSEEEIRRQRQQMHMTVYAQCISPNGKYLVAGNSYGTIAVFSINASLSSDANKETWKPVTSFKAYEGAVYALASTEKFLISAGCGDIKGWAWTDVLQKNPKQSWSLSLPASSNFGAFETNSLAYNSKDDILYTGGGDCKVYAWDLENGTKKVTFSGHADYIHCVSLYNQSQQFASSAEDGTVRIWDTRTSGEAVHIIEPHKHEECARPQHGKWLGCVALDPGDEWLVCGGGPSLSLWHMRSLTPTVTFDAPNCCSQVVTFHDDSIISGGSTPFVYHWNINGVAKTKVPCTATSVFSLAINTESESNKVLCVSGNSALIDIYTNFGYRAFSLDFC